MSNRSQLFTADEDGLGVNVVFDAAGEAVALGIFGRDRTGRDCVLSGGRNAEGEFVLVRGLGVRPGDWPQPPAHSVPVGRARFTPPGPGGEGAALHLIHLVPELGPTISPPPPAINRSLPLIAVTAL